MVSIRRLSQEGDTTTECTLAEAVTEVETAHKNGMLVVNETDEQKRIIKDATGLTEKSKLAIFPKIAGG